jgi:hypothetical protein
MGSARRQADSSIGAGVFFSLLAGDTRLVRTFFFLMVRKGWFKNLMAYYGCEIELFVEDLCAEVCLTVVRKYRGGRLESIGNPRGYVFNLIKYRSLKETQYVNRLVRFDSKGRLW